MNEMQSAAAPTFRFLTQHAQQECKCNFWLNAKGHAAP